MFLCSGTDGRSVSRRSVILRPRAPCAVRRVRATCGSSSQPGARVIANHRGGTRRAARITPKLHGFVKVARRSFGFLGQGCAAQNLEGRMVANLDFILI